MLSPADRDLIRRDPDLPGLATVLDGDVLLDTLHSRYHHTGVEDTKCTYLRYKPGTSCLVGYQVDTKQGIIELNVKALRKDDHSKFPAARATSTTSGAFGRATEILADRSVVVSFYPTDAEVSALWQMGDTASRNRLLKKLLPQYPDLWDGAVRTLRYRPERRCVLQLDVGDIPRAVIRLYTASGYPQARRSTKAVVSRGCLRIGRRLGRSNRDHALAVEWLNGQLLSDVIADPSWHPSRLSHVGEAIAELHAQSGKTLSRLTGTMQGRSLIEVAKYLGQICPPQADRAANLARRLAQSLEDKPAADCTIHGDFYAKQVLLDGDSVAVIDLDEAVRSDPAADLGNFVARLQRDALRGDLPSARVSELKAVLLEGYRRVAPGLIGRRVDLYSAATLVRLAPHHFRGRAPDWPERIEANLDRAEAILNKVSGSVGGTNKRRRRKDRLTTSDLNVPVLDRFDAIKDPKMTFLPVALDPKQVQRHFRRHLTQFVAAGGALSIAAIKVLRYKPQRRCVIEYQCVQARTGRTLTLIGKTHAKHRTIKRFAFLEALWEAGFDWQATDEICIPRPIGVVPALNMCVQESVPGVTATKLLSASDGVALAVRMAEAIHKVHAALIPARRKHTMADELRILNQRLRPIAQRRPRWDGRIRRILNACAQSAAATPETTLRGVHRDYYPDQVIVDGSRLYLLDFDTYCLGDPGLDVGNLCGHLIEQSLRTCGRSDAMASQENAAVERYVELAGEGLRSSITAYTTLTLARHIYISTLFPERRPTTESLIGECERRLGIDHPVRL